MMIVGGCNCGSVSYEIVIPANDIYLCHCSICRRNTDGSGVAQRRVCWVVWEPHMTKMPIREATLQDLPSLLRLEQNIIDSERPYYPFLKPDNVSYYDIPLLISDSNSYLVVVDSGSEIIGCGYAQIRVSKSCLTHDQHCYLGFIYLEPSYRGNSLGREIIEALKGWGMGKGVEYFRLEVYSKNESAIRAYEKAGFNNVSVLMELKVWVLRNTRLIIIGIEYPFVVDVFVLYVKL